MNQEKRLEIGNNIVKLFDDNKILLTKNYRITKTKNRNIEMPVVAFRNYYEETSESEFSRETILTRILLKREGQQHSGNDPIGTGIRTMQDFSFISKCGENYVLTYQFFDWIASEEDFYQYLVNQILEIRDVEEIRSIYNAILCVFNEWIKHGVILDFSGITDEQFLKKVKNKKSRKQYCQFVYENYGFAGDKRKKALPEEGNYCPDVLQRIRTVLLKTELINRLDDNVDGIKQYDLSLKGMKLLEKINVNIGIILKDGNLDECIEVHKMKLDVNDAPKIKRLSKNVKSKKIEKAPTSKTIKDKAKYQANYLCELEMGLNDDEKNRLFIERSTNKNYVEGHHLIPMEYAKMFNYSLDVEANVICLCPSCHRLLHHGLNEERRVFIEKLYSNRIKRLESCKLDETIDEKKLDINRLLELYKIS